MDFQDGCPKLLTGLSPGLAGAWILRALPAAHGVDAPSTSWRVPGCSGTESVQLQGAAVPILCCFAVFLHNVLRGATARNNHGEGCEPAVREGEREALGLYEKSDSCSWQEPVSHASSMCDYPCWIVSG